MLKLNVKDTTWEEGKENLQNIQVELSGSSETFVIGGRFRGISKGSGMDWLWPWGIEG